MEDVSIPEEQVDVLISEPLGTWLLNERMLETYIIARDRFLKKDGKMFPSSSHLCIQPFYDEPVYNEQMSKATFWDNKNFYGLDLTVLKEKAIVEKFQQPLIDTYDPKKNLSAAPDRMVFDFEKCTLEDLMTVDFYFKHTIERPGLIHGYAMWFDAMFKGSQNFVTLQTGPNAPATHWYQTRMLLREPLAVNRGQLINGYLKMRANNEQTYDVTLKAEVPILNVKSFPFLPVSAECRMHLRYEGSRIPRSLPELL